MATLVLTIALSWALGGLMHFWPHFPAPWRRTASIASSAAGLGFLLAGLAAEGLRETETTAFVVLGPSYLTGTSSASASLHYYVLTAVCLLLGFTGLVFGGPMSRWLSRHWLVSAASVAWLVTVIRFLLERSAAPALLIQVVGVTWMAPVAGAFFAVCLRAAGRPLKALIGPLVAYAFLVRAFVALVGILATRLHLGTHYDVSSLVSVTLGLTGTEHSFESGGWSQIFWLTLLPQLAILPLFTGVSGLLGSALVWRWSPGPGQRRTAAAVGADAVRD